MVSGYGKWLVAMVSGYGKWLMVSGYGKWLMVSGYGKCLGRWGANLPIVQLAGKLHFRMAVWWLALCWRKWHTIMKYCS